MREKEQSKVYSVLPLTAQDSVSAPASHNFVKKFFLHLMTAARQNRTDKFLNT